MLGKKFKTWPADSLSNTIFVIMGIYVTNIGYLEDGSSCFTEISDGGIEESNKILKKLNIVAVIPKTHNQNLPDLINLETK